MWKSLTMVAGLPQVGSPQRAPSQAGDRLAGGGPLPIHRLLASLLVPLLLAACTGVSTLTGEDHNAFYRPELVTYSSRNGVMPTTIHGAPIGEAQVGEMLAGLELPAGHPPARFAMTPAAQRGELGRIVLVFDPAPTAAGGQKACRLQVGAPVPQTPAPGRTRVLIAFCYGDGLASEGTVSVPNASPPTVAALVGGINLALLRVLPVTDPNRDRGCGAPC